jgi:hypothetical protein
LGESLTGEHVEQRQKRLRRGEKRYIERDVCGEARIDKF